MENKTLGELIKWLKEEKDNKPEIVNKSLFMDLSLYSGVNSYKALEKEFEDALNDHLGIQRQAEENPQPYKNLSYEEFKKVWDKTIDDLEPKQQNNTAIGEVSPGLYHLGNGVYTGKQGWLDFEKALKNKLKE